MLADSVAHKLDLDFLMNGENVVILFLYLKHIKIVFNQKSRAHVKLN